MALTAECDGDHYLVIVTMGLMNIYIYPANACLSPNTCLDRTIQIGYVLETSSAGFGSCDTRHNLSPLWNAH